MYDENGKIMIGNIDCTDYRDKFNIRSITRYRKLYEILINKGHSIDDFNELDHIFNRDIKIKLKILKHLFYIENRLGAEIVNFLLESDKEFIESFWNGDEFLKTKDDQLDEKIYKLNGEIINIRRNNKVIDLLNLADNLTFGSKIHLVEILRDYIEIHNSSRELKLSIDPSELKSFKWYRNKISHNEFIYDEKKEQLMKLLDSLGKYITNNYIEKFKLFYDYVNENFI